MTMTYQTAESSRIIEAPIESVAELATTVVSRLGWRVKFTNQKLKQLSAFDNQTERLGQDVWRFEFDAFVKWRKLSQGVEVAVTVAEKQMQWTKEHCAKRCSQILEGICNDAQELQNIEQEEVPPDMYGSAKWATSDDLVKAGYLDKDHDQRRFVLGPGPDQSFLSVPASETAMHAVVCGPTGSGKSSTIYIPNLIERTGVSAIVTEATAGDEPPDLFHKTAGFRQKAGHRIYKFNPDDMTSHRINPLDHVKTFDQAASIANLIIQNTSAKFSTGDQIWENSERHLLTVLVMHASTQGGHLGMIRRWLRNGADGLGTILMASPVNEVREEFRGFYSASSEGFRHGVVSGLMQRLNLWVSPRIVALTEKSDIDLKAMANERFTFYLAVPAQKTHLKPLAALIFNFVLNLSLESKFQYPLALFLDEFTNYGYVSGVAEKLTIIRHRDIPAALGFQDYVQLRKVYGDDDAGLLFSQPGTKIFFRPRDVNTARKISESLGTRTIADRKVTSSGHLVDREIGRPLMSSGEVMALAAGHAITFTPSTPPMLLKTFTWQQYVEATAVPPPQFRKLEVNEELVRLCREAKEEPDEESPELQEDETGADSKEFAWKPETKRGSNTGRSFDKKAILEKGPDF